MPAKRSAMRKITEVLRLKFEAKLSHEKIAAATGMSKGAVTNYVRRAVQKALGWSGYFLSTIVGGFSAAIASRNREMGFCRNNRWRLSGALMSAIRKPGNKTDQRRTRLLRHGNRSALCGSCASFR